MLLRKLNLGFYITMILIIITCMLLYFIVLYIKKDNNLMFILDKFKNKLKVGKKVIEKNNSTNRVYGKQDHPLLLICIRV